MNLLDIRTILFSYVITNAVCLVVVALLWFRNRDRFAGLDFWLADFAIQFLAILLIAVRGSVPDFLSMVVSNALVIAGTILLYVGLEFFVRKRTSQVHNYVLLAVFIFIHSYFTFVYPSLLIRTINLSVGIALLCSQCVWLLIYRVDSGMQPITRGVGYVFLAFCLVSITRIVIVLAVNPGNDFFNAGIFEALSVLINQVLFLLLSFSLLLTVNRRLVVDLEQDIIRREQAEEALRLSEEKFYKAFHSSPDAVLISRLRDGWLLEVNDSFSRLSGYSPQEALSSSSLNLGFWVDPQDRKACTAALKEKQSIHNYEYDFRTKSGKILRCFYSGEIIQLGGEEHVLSVVRDITEHKLLEKSLRYRTDILAASHQVMLDLVNRHNVEDVLQTLLVKISALLDVTDVSIDLVENNDTLVTYAATPDQPLVKGDAVRRGEGGWLSWRAVDSGEPAILEDYSTWSQRRELYEGFPIHAIAIIPIHRREQVMGAINFSRREPGKPFNDADIYVAEQLAQMVALVLDNAQLYTQLQSELAERRQVEENLRESQENFQRYFNMSTVGMCVTSPDRHWIETNARLRQMLGYSADELDHLTWSDITHPDDLDADLTLYNQVLANQRDSYQLDKRFIRKDGSLVYTTLFVTCHRNPDGTVRYLLASLMDITDRKQAEESLLKLAAIEERQRLARDLHDSVNQSIHGLVLFSETLVSTLEKNHLDRARQIAGRLQESARQALKETRLMLYEMQAPGPERSVDLMRDLETRLATVERRAGVRAQILLEGSLADCPPAWYENLFWITIEALNNALKHAQARNMHIKICGSSKYLSLEIVDDGIGFDLNKPHPGGMGLQNMHDRASLIGGELTILSPQGKGSRVCFRAQIKE